MELLQQDKEDRADQETGKPEDSAAGSASSVRKILVKIKHSKPASSELLLETPAPAPEIEIRVHQCKECNKSFSSGKALGGHMSSAHVQANKDYSFKKLKSRFSKSRESGSYSGSGLIHSCDFCGKNFPSQKSLYGHMRCHPEREYRGMDPPLTGQRNLFSSEEEEEGSIEYSEDEGAFDFVDSLKAWPVKAKRGRSARSATKSPEGSSSEYEEEEDEVSAGHQLLRLLKNLPDSDDKEEVGINVPFAPALVDDEVNVVKKRRGDDGWKRQRASSNINLQRQPKMKIWNTEDEKGKEELSAEELEADLLLGAICVLANGGKRDIDQPVVRREKHECSECKKVFPSHQALGGHKSSHNKMRVSIINTEDEIVIRNSKSDQQQQQQQTPGDNNNNDDVKHVCPICERVFLTSRALGGHRKIHNNNKGGSITTTAIGDDGIIGKGKDVGTSVRDFDLNMVPIDHDNGAPPAAAGGGDESDHMLL